MMNLYSKIHLRRYHGKTHGWKAMAKFLCLLVWLTWLSPASGRPVSLPVSCTDIYAWTRENLQECLDLVCEYRCLINVTGPQCVCPPHSFLRFDNRTCQDVSTSIPAATSIPTSSLGISVLPSEPGLSGTETDTTTVHISPADTRSAMFTDAIETDMAPYYPPASTSSFASATTNKEMDISSMFTHGLPRPVNKSSSKFTGVVDEDSSTSPSTRYGIQTSFDHVIVTPTTRFGETSTGLPFGTTTSTESMSFSVLDHQNQILPSEMDADSPRSRVTESMIEEAQNATILYTSTGRDIGIGPSFSKKVDSTSPFFIKPSGEVAESTTAFQYYSSEFSFGSAPSSPSFDLVRTDFIRQFSTEAAADSVTSSSLLIDAVTADESLQSFVTSTSMSNSYTADLVSPFSPDLSSVLMGSETFSSAKVDFETSGLTVALATPPLQSTIDTAAAVSKVHIDDFSSSTEAASTGTTQDLSTEGMTEFSSSVNETATTKLHILESFTTSALDVTVDVTLRDSSTVDLASASAYSIDETRSNLRLDLSSIFSSDGISSGYIDSTETIESSKVTLTRQSFSTEDVGFVTSSSMESESPHVDGFESPSSPVVPRLPATAISSELQASSDLLSHFTKTEILESYDTASADVGSASPHEPSMITRVQSLPVTVRFEASALLSSTSDFGLDLPMSVTHTLSDAHSMEVDTTSISATLDDLPTMPLGEIVSDLSPSPIASGISQIQLSVLTDEVDHITTSAVTNESRLSTDASTASKLSFSVEASPLTTGDMGMSSSVASFQLILSTVVGETASDSSETVQPVEQGTMIPILITPIDSEEARGPTTSPGIVMGQTSPLPSETFSKSIITFESSSSYGELTSVSVAATRITPPLIDGFGSSIPRYASDSILSPSPSYTASKETSRPVTSETPPTSLDYSSSFDKVAASSGFLQSEITLLETTAALRIPTSVSLSVAPSPTSVVGHGEPTETTSQATNTIYADGSTNEAVSVDATRSEDPSSVQSGTDVHSTPMLSVTFSTHEDESFKTHPTLTTKHTMNIPPIDTDFLMTTSMPTLTSDEKSFTRTPQTDLFFPESSTDITTDPSRIMSILSIHPDIFASGMVSGTTETTLAAVRDASVEMSSAGSRVLQSLATEEITSSGQTVADRSSVLLPAHPSSATVPLRPTAVESVADTTMETAGLMSTTPITSVQEQISFISPTSAAKSFTDEVQLVSSIGAAETEYTLILSTIPPSVSLGMNFITIMPTGTDRSNVYVDFTKSVLDALVSDHSTMRAGSPGSESAATIETQLSQIYHTGSALSTPTETETADANTPDVSALVSRSTQSSQLKSIGVGPSESTPSSHLSLPVPPTETVTLQITNGFTKGLESFYDAQPSASVTVTESSVSKSSLTGGVGSDSVSVLRPSITHSSVSAFASPSTDTMVTASESFLEVQPSMSGLPSGLLPPSTMSGVTTSTSSSVTHASSPHRPSLFTAVESGSMPFSSGGSLDILSSVSASPGIPLFSTTETVVTDSELSDIRPSIPGFPIGLSSSMKTEELISPSETYLDIHPSTRDTSEELLTSVYTESRTTESKSSETTSEWSTYSSLTTQIAATASESSSAMFSFTPDSSTLMSVDLKSGITDSESTPYIQLSIPVSTALLSWSTKVDGEMATSKSASADLMSTRDYSFVLSSLNIETTVTASASAPDIRPVTPEVSSMFMESSEAASKSLDIQVSSSNAHPPILNTEPFISQSEHQSSSPQLSTTILSVSSSIETEITSSDSSSPSASILDSSSRATRPGIKTAVSVSESPSSNLDLTASSVTSLPTAGFFSSHPATQYISHMLTTVYTEAVTPESESTSRISSPYFSIVVSSMHAGTEGTAPQFSSDISAVFGDSSSSLSSRSTPNVQPPTLGFLSGLLTLLNTERMFSASQFSSDRSRPTASFSSGELLTVSGTEPVEVSSSGSETSLVFDSHTSSTRDFIVSSVSEAYADSSFIEALPTAYFPSARSTGLMTSSPTTGQGEMLTMSAASLTPPTTRLHGSSTSPTTTLHIRPTPSTPRVDDSLTSMDSLIEITENVTTHSTPAATDNVSLEFTVEADSSTYAMTPADGLGQAVSTSVTELVKQLSSLPTTVLETSASLSRLEFSSPVLTTVEGEASAASQMMPFLSSAMMSEQYIQTVTTSGSEDADFVPASDAYLTSGMSSILNALSSPTIEVVVVTPTTSGRFGSSETATGRTAETDRITRTSTLPSSNIPTAQVSGEMESSSATGTVYLSMISGIPTSTAGVIPSESSHFVSKEEQSVSVTKTEEMKMSSDLFFLTTASRETISPTMTSLILLEAESTSQIPGVDMTTLASTETQSVMSAIEEHIPMQSSFIGLSSFVTLGSILPTKDVIVMYLSESVVPFALISEGSTSAIGPVSSFRTGSTESSYGYLSDTTTSEPYFKTATSSADLQLTNLLESSSSWRHVPAIPPSMSASATVTSEYPKISILLPDLKPSLIDSFVRMDIPTTSLVHTASQGASASMMGETTKGTQLETSSEYTFKPTTISITPTTVSVAKESDLVTVKTVLSTEKAPSSTRTLTVPTLSFTKEPTTDSKIELEKTTHSSVFVTEEFVTPSTESTIKDEFTKSLTLPVSSLDAMPVTPPATIETTIEQTKEATKPVERTTKQVVEQTTLSLDVSTKAPPVSTLATMIDAKTDVPAEITVKETAKDELTKSPKSDTIPVTQSVTMETMNEEIKEATKPIEKTTKPAVDQTTFNLDVATKATPFTTLATMIDFKTDVSVKATVQVTQLPPEELKATSILHPPSPDETSEFSTLNIPSSKDLSVAKETATKTSSTMIMASTSLSDTASVSKDLTQYTLSEMTTQSLEPSMTGMSSTVKPQSLEPSMTGMSSTVKPQSLEPSMTGMSSTVKPQSTSEHNSTTAPTSTQLTDLKTITPTPTTATEVPLPVVSNMSTPTGPSSLHSMNKTSETNVLKPSAAENVTLPPTSGSLGSTSASKPANLTMGKTSSVFNETVFIPQTESASSTASSITTIGISAMTEQVMTSATAFKASSTVMASLSASSTFEHSLATASAGSSSVAIASADSEGLVSSTVASDALGSTTRTDSNASTAVFFSPSTTSSISPAGTKFEQQGTTVPPATSEMRTTLPTSGGTTTMRSTTSTPVTLSTATRAATSLTASGSTAAPEITTAPTITEPSGATSNQTAHEVRVTTTSSLASAATSFARSTISSVYPESQSSSFTNQISSAAEISSASPSISTALSPVMDVTETSEPLPPEPHPTTSSVPAQTSPATSSTTVPATRVLTTAEAASTVSAPSLPTPSMTMPLTSERATSAFPLTQAAVTASSTAIAAHTPVTTFSDTANSTSTANFSTGVATSTTLPGTTTSTDSMLPSATVLTTTKPETLPPTTSKNEALTSAAYTATSVTSVPASTAPGAGAPASTVSSATAVVTSLRDASTSDSPVLQATTVSVTTTYAGIMHTTSKPSALSTTVPTFPTAATASSETKVPLTSATTTSSTKTTTHSTLPIQNSSNAMLSTQEAATTVFSPPQEETSAVTSSAALPTTKAADSATPVTSQQLTTESAVFHTKATETTAVADTKTAFSEMSSMSDSAKTPPATTAPSTAKQTPHVTTLSAPLQTTSMFLTSPVASREPATSVSTTASTSKVEAGTTVSVTHLPSTLEPTTKMPDTSRIPTRSTATPVPPSESIHAKLVLDGPTSDSLFNITAPEHENFKSALEKTLSGLLSPVDGVSEVLVPSLRRGSVHVSCAVLYRDLSKANTVRTRVRETLEKIKGSALSINGANYAVREVIVEQDLMTDTPAIAQSLTLPLGVGLGVPLIFLLVLGLTITVFCLVRATHRQPVEENDPWKLRAAFGRRSPSISARGSRRSFTSDMSNRLMSARYSRHWNALPETDHHGLPRPTLAEVEQGKAGRRPSNIYLQGVFPYNGDAAHTERSAKSKDSDSKQVRETTSSAFSWEMLMQYIDPSEEFRVQRPTVESTPSELYATKNNTLRDGV